MNIQTAIRPVLRPTFKVVFALFFVVLCLCCAPALEEAHAGHSPTSRLSAPPGPAAVPEAIERLMRVRVPVLALVLDAVEEQGFVYNQMNEALAEPVFQAVRWDQTTGTLVWTFSVAPQGELMNQLRTVTRAEAVAMLKKRLDTLAILAGIEASPDFGDLMGVLRAIRIPTNGLLSEEEWDLAQRELAAASGILLLAPHPEAPIAVVRSPDGSKQEHPIELPPHSPSHSP